MKNKIAELEATAAELQKQIAELKEQEAAKKTVWNPKGGRFFIKPYGAVGEADTSDNYANFGTERDTREAAEKAAVEMRKFNRLLAYRDEFAPGYKFKRAESNCFVLLHAGSNQYEIAANDFWNVPGVVYMPESVAKELAAKLNSGEVVL